MLYVVRVCQFMAHQVCHAIRCSYLSSYSSSGVSCCSWSGVYVFFKCVRWSGVSYHMLFTCVRLPSHECLVLYRYVRLYLIRCVMLYVQVCPAVWATTHGCPELWVMERCAWQISSSATCVVLSMHRSVRGTHTCRARTSNWPVVEFLWIFYASGSLDHMCTHLVWVTCSYGCDGAS